MKRKTYMTPTMNIVKLQHQSHLLAGSPVESAGVQDYKWNDEVEE